jgi:hypothetical protein
MEEAETDGADCINTPESFARANEKMRLEYLRSLTMESAARAQESILDGWVEFRDAFEGLDLPPPLPSPPPGPWLSIILEGKPSPDD